MVQSFAEALMGAEADAVCGAGYGERSDQRTNTRNGYRQGTEQAIKWFLDWLTSHERQVAAGVCLLAGAFMMITGALRVLS